MPSIILKTSRFHGAVQLCGRFPNRHIAGRVEERYVPSYYFLCSVTVDVFGRGVPAGDVAKTIKRYRCVVFYVPDEHAQAFFALLQSIFRSLFLGDIGGHHQSGGFAIEFQR